MRYDGSSCKNWLKGNTHIHSTCSDGGKTFKQLEKMYAAKGYDFLCRTDHWVASNADDDAGASPLLWIDGTELDGTDSHGTYYHVVFLGRFKGIKEDMDFEKALEICRMQGGLSILAHPLWLGLNDQEVLRWKFDGVELYNHVCQWLNGKGEGLAHWHFALAENPQVIGIAADDTHLTPRHPGWNGGWIMVNATSRTTADIIEAIRAGRFYSTTGPSFERIACGDRKVEVQTSPVRFIRLVGPRSYGRRVGAFRGPKISAATFEIPAEWPYAYVEIEDERGRRAWTNPLF